MSHYRGLGFFLLLLILMIPALILGLRGKNQRIYILLATLIMLAALFRTDRERIMLVCFFILQLSVAYILLRLRKKGKHCWQIWAAVIICLAPLVTVKISNLIGSHLLQLLGISYMTFRALQVLIDIYDGYIETLNPIDYSCFLLFFPAISSGPLDRYRRFTADIHHTLSTEKYIPLMKMGIWKLMQGALYNFVFGNLIWQLWIGRLPDHGLLAALGYFYGYTLFMFFNFAGYSRMATGTAYLMGVEMPDNFNAPFIARDMKDFWARWHISLSSFLRDYVYSRFCVTAVGRKWFGGGRVCSYLGYFITMLVMGFWHGLTPGYLIYGIYHGVIMSANDLMDTKWKKFRKIKKQKNTAWICSFVTFHLFAFGLMLFSGKII